MKKKYIDGSSIDPKWLLDYKVKMKAVHGQYKGLVVYTHLVKVATKITVDYDDSDTCLMDDGYKCIIFLPENKNWCVSVFYRPDLSVVEWYFDMTKENNTSAEKPYFLDLYLDVAVSADGKVSILDEDELIEAYEANIISADDVKLAHEACKEVIDDYINNRNFMYDFFEEQLNLLDE